MKVKHKMVAKTEDDILKFHKRGIFANECLGPAGNQRMDGVTKLIRTTVQQEVADNPLPTRRYQGGHSRSHQEVGDHQLRRAPTENHEENTNTKQTTTHDDDNTLPKREVQISTWRRTNSCAMKNTTINSNTRHPRHHEWRRSLQHTKLDSKREHAKTTTHIDGKHDAITITMVQKHTLDDGR